MFSSEKKKKVRKIKFSYLDATESLRVCKETNLLNPFQSHSGTFSYFFGTEPVLEPSITDVKCIRGAGR